MTRNMGTMDRIIRTAVAVGIAVLYFTGVISGTLAIILVVIGAVFLLTSMVGTCPAYSVLGVSTCGKDAGPAS